MTSTHGYGWQMARRPVSMGGIVGTCVSVWMLHTWVSDAGPSVMHSLALAWNFDDGLNGWAQSTPIEMGMEVDAINGFLRGIVLPSTDMARAFVDSPELRVDVDPDEKDHLIFRMKYLGQCDRAAVILERNPSETSVDPGVRRERRVLHDPITIPFRPRLSSLDYELYVFPIWKHVKGTIHRVRLQPCTTLPPASVNADNTPWSGQTVHLDWVAFAKAPVITKVRGCIDKYYQVDSSAAFMNCTESIRHINGVHANSAFICSNMELPVAATYNCLRDGGQRIKISGKHFGSADAIVTVNGQECTDVIHTISEVELECTLPPVSPQWQASPSFPSMVRVTNGRLHALVDEAPLLSYAAPIDNLAAPTLTNVAAHAVDVNWAAPPDPWQSMTITGYRVEWKVCSDALFDEKNMVIVGNVTSTTIIGLRSSVSYQARVTALVENYLARVSWQLIDLYGRRQMLEKAVVGSASPLSSCVKTLASDVHFPSFSARLLTNISASMAPLTPSTIGPTGEIGDQGHFGLYVNGDTNVENCNTSVTCCDSFDPSSTDLALATASCAHVYSVTETRYGDFLNSSTFRTVATNALFALPTPAKIIQLLGSVTPEDRIAPVTAPCGPALRLTASSSFQTGSAWYPRQLNVREGFETVFSFRLSNPSTICQVMDDVHTRCRSRGGDGFAFVVQNDRDIRLGSGGKELGYGGLSNAVAIEFDTWYNHDQLDAYENHVSVHVSRKGEAVSANHTFSLGSTTNIPDLTDGIHTVRVVYEPNMDENDLFGEYFTASTLAGDFFARGDWLSGVGMLSVFMDNMNSPVLAVPLRLEDTIELNHGRAWVGFTASTGANAYQAQDILSWKFDALRQDIIRMDAFTTVVF